MKTASADAGISCTEAFRVSEASTLAERFAVAKHCHEDSIG
jgi:hypothetical protein